MSEKSEKKQTSVPSIESFGQPLIRENVQLGGIAMEPALADDEFQVLVKGSFSSIDDHFFNEVATHLMHLLGVPQQDSMLVVISPDRVASIYLGNFPQSMTILPKGAVKAGQAVYESDIADIQRIRFEDDKQNCGPKNGDQLVWLFRHQYHFGLYVDLTGNLEVDETELQLANLLKAVKYGAAIEFVSSKRLFDLIEMGWFPFVSLMKPEISSLDHFAQKGGIDKVNDFVISAFNDERIQQLVERWWGKAAFSSKKNFLEAGLDCYFAGNHVAAISTLIPMIEGIADEHHKALNNGRKLSHKDADILTFLGETAGKRFPEDGSLVFPNEFKTYLEEHFFKKTGRGDPKESTRHPVTHGRAPIEAHSKADAIRLILTLDHLYFVL